MQDFAHQKIILGVCGGIAAYKSAFLARELTRLGAQVRVVMTRAAQEFITPMTFQALTGNEVHTELLDAAAERAMGHIELARWADLVVIAPATANFLAKMANGLADDLLSTLYLVTEMPVIVCPAMNRSMWSHPATQTNHRQLSERGVIFAGPAEGSQACGEEGFGRLSEVYEILTALRLSKITRLLAGRKVIITAGPTQEAIDPVRYISNRSSGKMGYALAAAAVMAGAEVTLISGPTQLSPVPGAVFSSVNSADEMEKAVAKAMDSEPDIFISCAAVGDYRVEKVASEKIKKEQESSLHLTLIQNPDILANAARSSKAAFVVGFALETENAVWHAREKLERKKVDMIIANQTSQNTGFDSDENEVTILTQHDEIHLSKQHKTRLAAEIIAIIASKLHNVTQKKR